MKGRRPDYAWDDLSVDEQKDRFMRHVEIQPGGCWHWIGKRQKTGYGRVEISSFKKKRSTGAHRLAWELFVGPIPDGKMILHKCDNPPCVNYTRCLFIGTQKDNIQDMLHKGRNNPPRGMRSGKTVLTDDIVRSIRSDHANGMSQKEIAARIGVSAKQISVIVNRIQWTHI